jgi:carbon storage regulator CsrA
MLVLSRKTRESAVVVGHNNGSEHALKVTVLEVRSGKVKLGFEADAAVLVHRLEVWERMRARGQPATV